jgi:vancomycin permeability regulator SanA
VRIGLGAALALVLLAAIPFAWTRIAAAGQLYDETELTATADVALVLGAQVTPDGLRPMPFLKGRLDTAADLVRTGHAKVILVSGDGQRSAHNETKVMAEYLVSAGISPSRIVTDPAGLDTYDSCWRAKQVYGLSRALVVTQPYHLARAVALCRHLGIDAIGVGARCDCSAVNLVRNTVRDYFACTKAALDAWRDRGPAIVDPPSDAVARALSI